MVSLGHVTLEPDQIIDFLKREMQIKDICQRMIRQGIVERVAHEQQVIIESDEIQAEADAQRHRLRLENAADTYAWLADQLVTPEIWEAGIRDRLLAQKLAHQLFDRSIEGYFVEHRLDFEQVLLYRLVVPYELLAQELFYQIEEGEISFFEAAHLYDINDARRLQCGYEGRSHRWSLPPQIAALVFSAKVGEVIGPVKSDEGYDLLLVEELISSELTDDLRQVILNRLFSEWMERELAYESSPLP